MESMVQKRGIAMAAVMVLTVLGITLAIPTTAMANVPIVRTFEGASLNWSGYAVSVSDVTKVTGTFSVPTVSGPGSVDGLATDVSVWVGIDGYTSGTVEQVGVSGSYDEKTGTASYYAWWELYPRFSMPIRAMTVQADDVITATVEYLGGSSYKLSIEDVTSGRSFSTVAHAAEGGPNVPQRNSAEWIVERAATIYKGYLTILPLASFTPVQYYIIEGAYFTVGDDCPQPLQYAVNTYEQYTGEPAPSLPYWDSIYIVGYNSDTGQYDLALDETSPVTFNAFTITFIDNGAPIPLSGIFRKK